MVGFFICIIPKTVAHAQLILFCADQEGTTGESGFCSAQVWWSAKQNIYRLIPVREKRSLTIY
jgi:hypothetical protein